MKKNPIYAFFRQFTFASSLTFNSIYWPVLWLFISWVWILCVYYHNFSLSTQFSRQPTSMLNWYFDLWLCCDQGNDVGTQYRSGIYFYTPEQEKLARESLERHQQQMERKIMTEILPAKKFYRAEEHHQQYLSKGGRFGQGQSTAKGCNDPIRCYG